MRWIGLAALLLSTTASAQPGPGLGNRAWPANQVFDAVGFIESPRGHGNATMVRGYLMVIYSSDGGGRDDNGGIEMWDVSDPTNPTRVAQFEDDDTHQLREAHGFSLAWYGPRLLLAAQTVVGVMIWDVTDPRAIQLVSHLDLPGIDPGDYSGGWWLYWQAPWIYLAGVDSGLYVVDATDPANPSLAHRMPTGELGGVSPAQVFAFGNLAVLMESQSRDFATVDISIPTQPRLLRQFRGKAGYSHIFAADGKIMTSGNIPPRAHFFGVTHDGDIRLLDTVGFFLDSGGYGSYQDGIFHSGWSDDYQKFRVNPPEVLGSGSSGRTDRDEDFATVLGNLVFVGDDHGTGSALIPHDAAPDTAPPLVEWIHPPDGASQVALTTRVGLSFSDHIDADSLNESTVWIEDGGGNRIETFRSCQMSLVNLAPSAELALLTTYTVHVDGVRDVAGNAAPAFSATFTTGDGAVAQSPSASVTDVDLNIAIGRYAIATFGRGKPVYSDRDYTFTANFPPRLDGQAYIRTANVDRINFLSSFMSFELLRPAEVLVGYDRRASAIPNWLGRFTPTGETVETTDTTFELYSRDYSAGRVELGGNSGLGSSGARSNYTVIIVPEPVPCDVDLSPVLTGTVTLAATGPVGGTYEWRVDGSSYSGANPQAYLQPGRHSVFLTVTDGPVSATCGGVKIAHRPAAASTPVTSSPVIWHDGDTININPDNGTVTRVDGSSHAARWETNVGGTPTSLSMVGAELWVLTKAPARIAVLDVDGAEQRSIALPRASAPEGLIADPDGVAYVTLSATGEVAKIVAGNLTRAAVTPTARGITWFDGRLYVTRFVSSASHGEVHVLDAQTLGRIERIDLAFDPTPDTEAAGRGVPNYVAEVRISADGTRGWVASKKDNVARGVFRDGQPLTFESRVRAIVSTFDVATSTEPLSARLDVNDRELILTTLPTPLSDLLFVASSGVSTIDVFDTALGERVSQFEVPQSPRGLALNGGTLAVWSYLARSVSFYDVGALLAGTSNAVEPLGVVPVVASEALPAEVLAGKRIFHDASDPRMSRDSYISCASCHLDGGHDGQTWDFTQAGEGLRNTITLNGRAGTGHGNVHWTANFDEIQDFENDIRGAFGGTGFLTDADFAMTSDPLGVAKAGRSTELDALATYVATLDRVPDSPHRRDDGTLDEPARRGRVVFTDANCQRCHGGAAFSDFTRHDVGTAKPSSGLGIGQPLAGVGFETPTLLGVWTTQPYLHDGSAATLADAMGAHGDTPTIAGAELADLVAYLRALDHTSLPPEAPCDQGPNECVGATMAPDAGVGMDGAAPGADASPASDAALGPDAGGPDVGGTDGSHSDGGVTTPGADAAWSAPMDEDGCGCSTSHRGAPGTTTLSWLALPFLVALRRRRLRR